MGAVDLKPGLLDLRTLLDLANAATRIGVEFDLRPWLVGPYIAGIEVTQGIQYYRADRHLTNADDRGPDNSVRLTARKPAWVRVYVRSGLIGGSHDLTGEVLVEHRTGPFLAQWTPVATLTPLAPGAVTSQQDPTYVTERGTLASSLNFVVAADVMWGMVRLTARVWRVGDATRTRVDTWQEAVDATMLQTLHLRGIFVTYSGPDPTINATSPPTVNLPAPTVANLQSTAAWTLTTNPVASQALFSTGGTMNWFVPLTGTAPSGGCSPEWQALTYWLSLVKNNDGNRSDVIYYGLLPAATPIANVGGCELYGVSAGPDGRQQAMAHEIGHGAGLLHGPCGVSGNVDATYPAYEPYDPASTPMASLGEYGLDITTGTIHPPGEKDYMSYCGPPTWNQWISLYHHARLCFADKFNPRRVGVQRWQPPDLVDPYLWPWEYMPDPPFWERHLGDRRLRAQKLISILGLVDEERQLHVQSVMRLTALPRTRDAVPTAYVAQLIGENGEVAASAPVVRLPARGGTCGGCAGGGPARDDGPYVFEAMVPDAEPGTELRIVRRAEDGARETVWMRQAPRRRPRIARFAVTVGRGYGVATWEARAAADAALHFSLQFSKDDGRSWNGLTVGVTGSRHRFALTDLPSGRLLVRLLAHDGFHSVSAVSRPIEVPARRPTASILHPQAGPPLLAGAPMRLWGAVTCDDGRPIDPEACAWQVDERPVARGLDLWIEAPEPGEHRCTLTVRGRAGTAEVTGTFRTVDPARPDLRGGGLPPAPAEPAERPAPRRRGPRARG